jgi:hypothetical protein
MLVALALDDPSFDLRADRFCRENINAVVGFPRTGGANFKVPLTSAGRTGRRRDCQVAGLPAYFRPAG